MKADNGEQLSGRSVVVGNEFGAGNDEAAGHLRGEKTEQRQIG